MKKASREDRRSKSAAKIERLSNGVLQSMDAIPSYRGKARFMDKVINLHREIHSLAFDLKHDAIDARESARK